MKYMVTVEGWESMELEIRDGKLTRCHIAGDEAAPASGSEEWPIPLEDYELACEASRQLKDYFAGHLREFSLPLAFGGSSFQHEVWKALLLVPYGEVRSYAEIARSIGRPQSFRAVAGACRDNPIGVIIPCHRIISSDGSIGGYNGGIERKHRLLELEGRSQNLFEL